MNGTFDRSRRRQNTAWVLLFVIALSLRLGWGLSRPTDAKAIETLPDQREYLELGRHLLDHGTLRFVDPRFDQTVYAFRMPGYPLLIAACSGDVRAVRSVQAVVDTGTVAAAGLLAMSIFETEAAAFVAAAFVAVNPFLIYFSGLMLSDTLYAAMFAWALLLLQRRKLLVGSALLAVGVLVRPSGLLPAVVLPGIAAVMFDRSFWAAVRTVGVSGFLVVLTLLPWAYRNQRILNVLIFTTTNTGFTLYDGFHDGATGDSDQRFIQSMPKVRMEGEVARSIQLEQQAMAWICSHPMMSVKLAGWKLLRFWSPVPLSDEFSRPAYRIVGATYATIDVLALYTIWTFRRRWQKTSLLIATLLVFSAVHAASVGSLRYRLPLEPAIAILAAGTTTTTRSGRSRVGQCF